MKKMTRIHVLGCMYVCMYLFIICTVNVSVFSILLHFYYIFGLIRCRFEGSGDLHGVVFVKNRRCDLNRH